ncbi:MAG: hypothetical protein H0T92_15780 [Pyrinomonadaceae bacterium]|nr:hypothetical protein [Pyrinomonadaceae bacterium]
MSVRFWLSTARLVIACALLSVMFVQLVTPTVALAQGGQEVAIPDGTEFAVVTTEELSSKTASEGDPLTFKVAENVTVGGRVVIAEGAIVKGIVSEAQKSGMMGRGGKLNIRVESVAAVDGQKIKLRAAKAKTGNDKTGATVALTVIFGPLGLIKKGKNAKIPANTKITVFTDEEKKVQVKA